MTPLDRLQLADREHWTEGPSHELFARLRRECPVHWTHGFAEFSDEDGFWSVTKADETSTRSAATGRPTPPRSVASPR